MKETDNYALNLLKDDLDEKTDELSKLNSTITHLRNKIATSTHKGDYFWLKKDLDVCENDRRVLRGKCSALRQAITKLEKENV